MKLRKIETYKQLDEELLAWKNGKAVDGTILHICLMGVGGIGKTERLLHLLDEKYFHLHKGRTSPRKIFDNLCEYPNNPIVLDDISGLLHDKTCTDLVKQICEVKERRRVCWHVHGQPNEDIIISSKVCLIVNSLPKVLTGDLEAIYSRLDLINFCPSRKEIWNEAKNIFPKNREKHIDSVYQLPISFSFRSILKYCNWYVNQGETRAKANLLSEYGIADDIRLMADIIAEHDPYGWQDIFAQKTNREKKAAIKYWNSHKKEAFEILEAQGAKLSKEKINAIVKGLK